MANETGAFFSLHAVLLDIILHMAFRAVIHLHPVPGICLKAANVFTPNIAAVTGNDIILVYRQTGRLANIAMAGVTFHLAGFYMGRV